MDRACFTLEIAPARIADYITAHAQTWPELVRALDASGWRNYSIFLRNDGTLIGYWESPDPAGAMAAMDELDVSRRWSLEMDDLVVADSTMQHPPLVAESGAADGDRRFAFRLPAGHPFEPRTVAWSNLAVFAAANGERIVYGETANPTDEVLALAAEFPEVFNLDQQLRRVS